MGQFARVGWTVCDADGQVVGTITRLSRSRIPDDLGTDDSEADPDFMMVETNVEGLRPMLAVPITAIRAAANGRLLLTEPSSRFAELGWTVPAEDLTRDTASDTPARGSLRHRPATA
jgi:hypothetical protein